METYGGIEMLQDGSATGAQLKHDSVVVKLPMFTKYRRLVGGAVVCQDSTGRRVIIDERMSHNNVLCDAKQAPGGQNGDDQGDYRDENTSHNTQDQPTMGTPPLCPPNSGDVTDAPPAEICDQNTKIQQPRRRGGRVV